MTDLLVQRLKSAKRELTALKTAHRRGLGLIKIYKEFIQIDITGHETGIYFLSVQVNFKKTFASFPFAEGLPNEKGSYATLLNQLYSNDGYSLNQEYLWITDDSFNNHAIVIFSTSPIESTSYSWSKN